MLSVSRCSRIAALCDERTDHRGRKCSLLNWECSSAGSVLTSALPCPDFIAAPAKSGSAGHQGHVACRRYGKQASSKLPHNSTTRPYQKHSTRLTQPISNGWHGYFTSNFMLNSTWYYRRNMKWDHICCQGCRNTQVRYVFLGRYMLAISRGHLMQFVELNKQCTVDKIRFF